MQNISRATRQKKVLKSALSLIRLVYNPLLFPTYITAIIIFGNSYFNAPHISVGFKWLLLSLIFIITAFLPAILLPTEKGISKKYFKPSFTLFDDPILVSINSLACYIAAMVISSYIANDFMMVRFFYILTIFVSSTVLLNYIYTIDFRATALGGFTAFLIMLDMSGYGNLTIFYVLALLFAGLLSSLKIYIGGTTLARSSISYVGGVAIITLIWLL